MEALEGLAVSASFGTNIEVNHMDAEKGKILAKVAQKLNIKKDEIVVLGDGLNDYSMFIDIVSIGKNTCIVIQISYIPPKDKDISVKQRHFIEIMQRQESMITCIDELIEKVNKTNNLVDSRKIVYQYLPKFNEKKCR